MADRANSTPAPAVHPLEGSSKPGAAPRFSSKQASRPKSRQKHTGIDDQHAAVIRLAKLHGLDTEVIELAERTESLALRERSLWGRRADVDDAVNLALPPRPVRPTMQNRMQHADRTVDGARTFSVTEPPEWRVEAKAIETAYAAAVAEYERLEVEIGARLGLPLADKLASRASRRLSRWSRRLATLAPRTYAGLRAKAAVLRATVEDGQLYDTWRQVLAVSVGADAIRLVDADTEAFVGPDEFLIELGAQWEANARILDVADREEDAIAEVIVRPEPPQAVYACKTDHPNIQACGVRQYQGLLWYGFPGAIDKMHRVSVAGLYGGQADPNLIRRQEIIDAYYRWQDEIEAAEAACGLTRAKAKARKLRKENERLRSLIILSPAATIEGLLVKAMIAHWCLGDADEYIDENKEAFSGQAYGEHIVASATVDLLRMVEGRKFVREREKTAAESEAA